MIAGRRSAASAVEQWFEQHHRAVYQFVARRLGEAAAVDLTAEVFRIALERFETFDQRHGEPRGWLFGIAANLVRGHWRTEERRLRALQRSSNSTVLPIDPLLRVDDQLVADAELARVLGAVANLTPEDRDLLTLYAWEGCSYAEIATALDIPVGTVRSRLHRIRRNLAAAPATESHT